MPRISKPAQLSQCCSAALSAQAAVCLENSGISTERACRQSAAFEKCCINWAQLHSGLPLPGSCQGAMRHTQPALCCQEVPVSAQPQARCAAEPTWHDGTGLTMQHGTHFTHSCVEKSQTEYESPPETACKSQESLLINSIPIYTRKQQDSLCFLTNTHMAYPNSPAFSSKGVKTGTYSQDSIIIVLIVLSWGQ